MSPDSGRLRYLADAVSTATPAQRIVMLYDRMGLDIERAASAGEPHLASPHIRHAQQIVAELMSSLDASTWSGADNLAALYGFVLTELIATNADPDPVRLRAVGAIVSDLRQSWFDAAQILANEAAPSTRVAATAGAWVG